MVDIEEIRSQVSLPNLASDFGVALRKNGAEWEGLCPFHDERTPSFSIFTGKDGVERFHCFGCGEKGDAIDFVRAIKGVETKEAIAILGGGQTSRPNVERRRVEARDPYAGIELLTPRGGIRAGEPVRLYNPKREHWGSATPSMVFPYYRDGQPLGCVLRIEREGGKETPMVCWVRLPDGTECWCRFPFPKPRPLYIGGGAALRDGQVIIVEGEKCADAVARATGRQAVSWAGGTYGVQHADWSPLAGRSVVIWPDADAPGLATAETIAATLTALGCTAKVLRFGVAA